MYRTGESKEDEEEVGETVYFNEGDEVNMVPFVYPSGTVSVSSMGYFMSVGSYSKPYHPSLPISVGARQIQEYFKNNRGRKQKSIKPQH